MSSLTTDLGLCGVFFFFFFCPRPRWGSAPDPAGGPYSAPRSLPLFKGPTSKGMEGNRRGKKR